MPKNSEFADEAKGTYSPDKQIKFETPMLRSSLCDYSDAYILVKGNTVKPVYNNHLGEEVSVVVIDRWSL